MNFTLEKLKEARDAGIPDDVIWEVASETEPKFLELKQNNIPIDIAIEVFQGGEPEPSGTSFGKEVSQLGSAFVESIGRPLESMGESFESFGFSGVANALKGAITEPENYVSAGQRFMEPAPNESQLMGFAWQYAPRAAVEQVGQAIGSIGTRAVGAGVGGAVAGPPGAIAGGFLGPAVFGAAQVIGPVAKERAMNNGREVPNNEDLVAATLTAIGSGSLDAIGAKYLPGGDKATGKFFKRVASSFIGEGLLTEAPQSVIEQIGSTAGTEKGLNINVKQAVGEGLIGGTSAAGLTAIVSPFSKPVENQVIRTPEEAEELDINSKSNQEAILLMGDPADQTQNERITKLKEIESVIANNETLMTGLEPNAAERSKLDLENRVAKKEAEKLKAEITQGAGLSVPITTIEEQQAALAKAITTPAAPKPLPTDVLPTETPSATYGREEQVYDVFGGITRKPVAIPVEQVVTPPVEVAPTIAEKPMSVSDEKEFAELNDLMGRKGQAENKVRGVKFTKQDQSRYQNLLTKFRDRLIETTDPKNDPVVGTDINGTPIQQSNKGTFYTFQNGRVRTGPAFSEATPAPVTEQPIEAKPQRYVLQQIGATSGEWRTIQILPNKEAADAEQAKLPEGATGWRIIPETPVTEQAAPAEAPAAKELQIGDEITIMQVPSVLADTKKIAGVKWDIFNGAKLAEKRAAVRITDEESGEVLQIKQFKNYDEAETYFKTETDKAQKLEKPAPEAPAPSAAPAEAPAPEVAPDRLYLNVPFRRKEGVKLYGAKFDSEKKLWYLERNQAGKFPLISPSFVQEAEATSRSAKELEPARINAQNQLEQEVEISPFEISTGTAYGLKIKGGDWINKNINLEIERAKTKVEPIAGGGTEMATMESQPSTPGGISPDQKSRNAGTALAKAYPFKGIQTQTEEKRFLAKAKESLKKLGVKAWEFDSSVERLKTRKARESGGRITYVNDRSIYLQLITDGFLAQPTAVEPTPAVSETITPAASLLSKLGEGWKLDGTIVSKDGFGHWTEKQRDEARVVFKKAGIRTNTSTPSGSGNRKSSFTIPSDDARRIQDEIFAEDVKLRKAKNEQAKADEEVKQAEKLSRVDPAAKQWMDSLFGSDDFANPANKVHLSDFVTGKTTKFGGMVNPKWFDGAQAAGAVLEGNKVDFQKLKKNFENSIAKTAPAVSETITEPAKPKVKAKQKIKPQAPVLDPIGYGNALIDLFPTLKSAGVKAISMEESLARLEKQWEEKQKSGKATRLDQLVYLANKKNTEDALAGDSVGGTWSRTDLTVAVSSKATPSAMSHEIGHAIMELEFANADQKTKNAIIAEYNKWFASTYGKNGVPSVVDQRRIWEWMSESDWLDPKAPFPQEKRVASWEQYRSSFKEWFADEVAKWATTNAKPKSLIEKFFTELAAKLNKLWNAVSENFAPNETLATWLDSITDVSPSKVEFAPKGDKIELLEATPEPSKTTRQEQIKGEKIGPPKKTPVKRGQVASIKNAGPEKKTPKQIIARTRELLRKDFFNPAEVTEQNTLTAFRALGKLVGPKKQAAAYAEELNDIGRLVDEEGVASEVSMGAILFTNDLFEYSIKLAAEGQKMMLGIMMSNMNKLPLGEGLSLEESARSMRGALERSTRFTMMGKAEQDAFANYVAEFIYGPNPTKEQIQSIKDAYAKVEKTALVTEQELTDEIAAVGGRTRTDLVGKINEEFTKATEKGKEKRKTEEAELDEEYKKIQNQADAEIEKLAKIQSDTPSFDPAAARQTANDVRAIVANDLKQRPDIRRKAPWKSMLVAKLQEAGVELTAAETLADIVWRQHEINNLSRELSSINKAIEKGPISEIVKAIKETPLEDQQKPNWRYEVMRDYLRKAGLNVAQSERIAKLMDISLQKRFTMAQEEAFTQAISKTAPWKSGDTRSRRAFQKVLQALRAGALDPARNVLSDMAALNGWTGFTPEQYKTLLKYDAILADPESADATKAQAHKVIQDVISKAKLPIRARDVIGQYYDAQALSGIPTVTVNIFSPAGIAVKNALTQALNGVVTARPEQITASLTTFIDSIKSWANTVAFSFKNNVTVYSNVEYLVNDEGLLKLYKKGVDQFNNGKTPRDRADGVKNMMIGMMDYVRRILNALDYGAIASLQNQSVSKYALAAMQAKGMPSKDGAKMLNAMMEEKRNFYNDQIAIGTDKNKAAVLADEFFVSSWRQALTDAKLPAQQVMDAALNDAMSAVGRNRQSLDAFREEETDIRDNGVTSFPAIWLLETMANAANRQDSQFIKIFSRIIYGFAIVPARVLRETAWFSPYGAVRFAYDAIAKKMGKTSPYAQSLGNDLQYRQRLTETIAGSLVMLAFGAAMSASTDDEDDEKPFKIVVTGNGPLRSEDPQYYDSWVKNNRPNTVRVQFGKTKFTLNTMRGFEAFAWPAMMLGAVDDWHIRRKQGRTTNTPLQMQDGAIVAGNVLSASLRRGPYAFAAKPLFEAYGDRGVESLAKSLAFPAKTIVPVLGSSLASNLSNFLNEPVDRRTLEGALWANVPFIGPTVAPKSLNAFGEPAMANDAADKIFKLGVPIVFDIPTDRDSVNLHELVLKQGGGPSIPTRNQLAQRLDRQPTNKEYEMFAKEYGAVLTKSMKKNYEKLFAMKPEAYTKVVERIGNRARDIAENKVRVAAKKP